MKKEVLALSAVSAAMLAAGALFDLPIAEYIYRPDSAFGQFFAVFGALPQYAVQFLPLSMLFAILFEKRRTVKAAAFIPALAALLLITAASIHGAARGLSGETGFSAVFLAAFICFTLFIFFLAALPFAKRSPNELFTVALTGLLAFNAGYAALQTLKTFWGRRRFFTMDNPGEQFTKWFLPQGKAVSDDFTSFPSGHSFAAMCAVWFALWPRFIPGLKKYTRLIFVLALLFGLTVMVSRMVIGRHFLSDVSAGAALSLASFALANAFVKRFCKRIVNNE